MEEDREAEEDNLKATKSKEPEDQKLPSKIKIIMKNTNRKTDPKLGAQE